MSKERVTNGFAVVILFLGFSYYIFIWTVYHTAMKGVLIIAVLFIFGVFGWIYYQNQDNTPFAATKMPNSSADNQKMQFSTPKKSPHYESNTPEHSSTLAGVPINVVINFNFDLAKPSEIKILKNGKDYGGEETIIDDNKLTMRRKMSSNAPNGLYTVEYKACWPDGSCHDGSFQFAIDRTKARSYEDQTGKKEVTIKLSQIQFKPQNIKVSKGTKVTWINDDGVEHYVNTDSHPAHTYYPAQNSKSLSKGDQFSLTFDQPGIYPYHCSAHASSMVGSLLVE